MLWVRGVPGRIVGGAIPGSENFTRKGGGWGVGVCRQPTLLAKEGEKKKASLIKGTKSPVQSNRENLQGVWVVVMSLQSVGRCTAVGQKAH